MTLQKLIYLVLTLVLAAVPATAQTPRSSSSPRRSERSPQSASRSRLSLAPLLAQFHSPSWTWFVVRDEAGWKQFEDHIGFTFETYGNSNIPPGRYRSGSEDDIRPGMGSHSPDLFAQPRHIVAHELGHITLNTHNEAKAERKGMELLYGQTDGAR